MEGSCDCRGDVDGSAVEELREGDGLRRGPNRGEVAVAIDPTGRLDLALCHRAQDRVPMGADQLGERVMRQENPVCPDESV